MTSVSHIIEQDPEQQLSKALIASTVFLGLPYLRWQSYWHLISGPTPGYEDGGCSAARRPQLPGSWILKQQR
ncbi:hypothetical protein NDU88_000308 [Pleurodeles waltl]|uniref:Uncharacterized protein n=1 Tax=Pleurodeles waltl TaxID=8319 RepID=A0AAV7URG1_PLEWA|nr:hypothetical protein NDU88_000308 [Pleurodeles waltl]